MTRVGATVAFWFFAWFLFPPAAWALPWYEHYQEGVRLALAGKCDDALAHLQEALQVEPEPKKRIRTYGTNFLFDYDPHLYMAQCYLRTGKLDLALQSLQVSQAAQVIAQAKLDALASAIARARAAPPAPATQPPLTPAANQVPVLPTKPVLFGKLQVDTSPQGAAVYIDGTLVGETPTREIAREAGWHTVRVERPGFLPKEAKVQLNTELLRLDWELQPLPTPASTTAHGEARAVPPRSPSPAPRAPSGTPRPTPAVTLPNPVSSPEPSQAATPAALAPQPPPTKQQPSQPARWWWYALAAAGAVVLLLLLLLARRKPAAANASKAPTIFLEQEKVIGGYRLVRLLGAGGMGSTYLAVRERDGMEVALKLPHQAFLQDPTFRARFLREGKLGEQLHHPNIVRILEAGEDGGQPFLAMELVKGETIKAKLRKQRRVAVGEALRYVRDIAEALDYAHSKGVVHRDLKPENVMVAEDGSVKVMDFGLARVKDNPALTSTGLFMGTPYYAAPESITDPKHADHRTDLYALGILFYEMLAGKPPFTHESPYRILEMHLHDPFPSRESLPVPVPDQLWGILTKLCAKNPEARFASAEALLVELQQLHLALGAWEAGPFSV